jgi:hypothetical protein
MILASLLGSAGIGIARLVFYSGSAVSNTGTRFNRQGNGSFWRIRRESYWVISYDFIGIVVNFPKKFR